MKKTIFISLIALLFAQTTRAQSFSFESVQLATFMVEKNWKQAESTLKLMSSGLREQVEKGGASKEAARVLLDEFSKNFTKDLFAKQYAQILTKEMTPQEISQIYTFVTSPAGSKFAEIFTDEKQGITLITPAMKAACEASNKKLSFFDRGSLNTLCGGL